MKVIVAGGREFDDWRLVCLSLYDLYCAPTLTHMPAKELEIVSGAARGADRLGERWAEKEGVPVKKFRADWHKLGRSAGPIRNSEMAEYADCLVAFWDGESRGTKNMIDTALKKGLEVHVYRYEKKESK